MKRLIISAFAAVALIGAATAALRSHSPSAIRAAAMMSQQEPHTAAGVVNKLPIEEFEDMSLVYSTSTKR